jgi:hypothetical protein
MRVHGGLLERRLRHKANQPAHHPKPLLQANANNLPSPQPRAYWKTKAVNALGDKLVLINRT